MKRIQLTVDGVTYIIPDTWDEEMKQKFLKCPNCKGKTKKKHVDGCAKHDWHQYLALVYDGQ